MTMFEIVAGQAASCLLESDKCRDAKGLGSGKQASSATNWIDDAQAFALQQALGQTKLKVRKSK